jgi:hypothetical protein
MAQRVLRIEGLPAAALDAAAQFHAEWLPRARAMLDPPRNGEVAARSADGGGSPPGAARVAGPLHHPSDGPPPRAGEDLVLVFPSAQKDHRAWRLAAVQGLAREAAPYRVNGIVGDAEEVIAEAVEWLAGAPGITGQLLEVAPD